MDPRSDISPKIRVLCVDDNRDITTVLGHCIDGEPDMECAGRLDSADDLAREIGNRRADVVLLDMKMPGRDPLEALREMTKGNVGAGGAHVIVFSGREDQEAIDGAADAGAAGFLCKRVEVTAILAAIREVAGKSDSSFGVWR